jgi:hypothetical protein
VTDVAEDRAPQPRTKLVLVAVSGAKTERDQPSATIAIVRAEEAIQRLGRQLREVKVVSRNKVIARWKLGRLPRPRREQ